MKRKGLRHLSQEAFFMITTAETSDLPDLVSLMRALNAYHADHAPDRFHDRACDADLLGLLQSAQADGARFLIYRTEGVARGYLKWLPVPAAAPVMEHPRRQALLDHIYVEPIWRRRGLASRLIARFEAEIAGHFDGWTVRVHAFNTASRALMQRHGAEATVLAYAKASSSSWSTNPR
ncbi:GNAT family N-acetyltransferase [Sagittula sp. NFXS13]